LTNTVINV